MSEDLRKILNKIPISELKKYCTGSFDKRVKQNYINTIIKNYNIPENNLITALDAYCHSDMKKTVVPMGSSNNIQQLPYSELYERIEYLYTRFPNAYFYFDFDNVLYTDQPYQLTNLPQIVNTIPVEQKFILTARNTDKKIKDLKEKLKKLQYSEFLRQNLIAAGYNKEEFLKDIVEKTDRYIFYFDDSAMNVYIADDEVGYADKFHIYWVDHYAEHRLFKESLHMGHILKESDEPFYSNNSGHDLVYKEALDHILPKAEIESRRDFYYNSTDFE